MKHDVFTGQLVRLVEQNPEKDPEIVAGWQKDTVYTRLLEVEPVKPSTIKEWRERFERPHTGRFYSFGVHTLADDKLIGFVNLMHVDHRNRDAWVGIGMGDSAYQGKGYGTDAMKVILRYAFQELNLHRVSLDAVATNARAVRSYEKCGYVVEGYTRGTEFRDGKRDDLVSMGILRHEWETRNG